MNLYYKRAAIFGLGLRRTQCQNVSTDSGRTHYEVLGVHRLATQKEIKDAYLAMSKKFHPDMVSNKSSVEEMVAVNVAYSVLSKPVERRDYDRRLGFDRYTSTHTEDGYEFKGRVYDRPASFDERVRQYGYPKPDAEYWDKAGGTQYKVLAGCLLFLLFGGVMRVFAVKTFMEREQKRSLEQVAKIQKQEEESRQFAKQFESHEAFTQAVTRMNAVQSQRLQRRREQNRSFFGSDNKQEEEAAAAQTPATTVSR